MFAESASICSDPFTYAKLLSYFLQGGLIHQCQIACATPALHAPSNQPGPGGGSRRLARMAASSGCTAFLSSIKSPMLSSTPMGASANYSWLFSNLPYLIDRHRQLFSKFFWGWFVQFQKHLPRCSYQLVNCFNHVNRDPNGSCLMAIDLAV